MGGRIRAEAEPGSGAKFFVELPERWEAAVEDDMHMWVRPIISVEDNVMITT